MQPEEDQLYHYMYDLLRRARDRHAETLREFGADPREVFGARETEPIIAYPPLSPGEVRYQFEVRFWQAFFNCPLSIIN